MNYRRLFIIALVLNVVLAAAIGWFWRSSRKPIEQPASAEHPPMEGFTAAPNAQQPLVPIELSPERVQSIGVKTGRVQSKEIRNQIRATGTVDVDERRIAYVQSRYQGWVRKVYVNATYDFVKQGQPLFTIYSPELVATQQEYLLAKANVEKLRQSSVTGVASGAESLLASARDRLRQWNVPDSTIAQLDASGKPINEFSFPSPVSGYVLERLALPNVYVQPEMKLYTIADLSSVWVHAQVFQEDAGKLKPGDRAEVSVDAYPGKTFVASVEQLLPQVDPATRTLRVRLTLRNAGLALKPGMFVNVLLHAALGRHLVIPASAILHSGTRQVVFVDRGNGVFEPHDVQLGPRADADVVVLDGLKEGEVVATSANFLIDSESQLQAAAGAYTPPPPGAGQAAAMNAKTEQATAELIMEPSPPRKGVNKITVKLAADGKPVPGATVNVRFFMAGMSEMGMPAMNTASRLAENSPGVYAGSIELGSGGTWQVTITAERDGKTVLNKRISVSATGGM
jgi:membrane fusion protein, copper/silver efflux system